MGGLSRPLRWHLPPRGVAPLLPACLPRPRPRPRPRPARQLPPHQGGPHFFHVPLPPLRPLQVPRPPLPASTPHSLAVPPPSRPPPQGATTLVKLGTPSPDELGFVKSLAVEEIGGTKCVVLQQDSNLGQVRWPRGLGLRSPRAPAGGAPAGQARRAPAPLTPAMGLPRRPSLPVSYLMRCPSRAPAPSPDHPLHVPCWRCWGRGRCRCWQRRALTAGGDIVLTVCFVTGAPSPLLDQPHALPGLCL